MSNRHVSHVPRGSPTHSRRNFPGCCGSSACDTVWSSKSQSEQSCDLERQKKKKALSRQKNWIPHVKPRKHKNYKSDVANVPFHNLSFRRGRFRLRKRGPSDHKICHVSANHVSTYSRPVRNFFFQISHIGGPSDQSSVNMNRPIKICHMSMCHMSIYSFPPNKRYEPFGDWHVACPATTCRVRWRTERDG
jgi:hypothetical protein